jgi:uncharacterized protein (TIGR02117 family)
VYVVDHGKHAGIVIKRATIPKRLIPEKADFPNAEYLEFGWGEVDYYPAPSPSWWLALKAALWPTPSVLHVVGIRSPPTIFFTGLKIVRLDLDRCAWMRLVQYIHASFARDGALKAKPLQRGLYGDSWFYPARGSFHLFNTCNGWVTKGLKFSGLPLGIVEPLTSSQLMGRLKRLGAINLH